jgi:hypothetical protein
MINTKLEAEKRNTEFEIKQQVRGVPDSRALVRVEAAIAKVKERSKDVDRWIDKNLRLHSAGSSTSRYDHSARTAGRQAARGIAINRARGALGE